jgi:hypothetical protein
MWAACLMDQVGASRNARIAGGRYSCRWHRRGSAARTGRKAKGAVVAFRIEGEDRKGRWLVTCDHASNRVPDWVNGGDLGIPEADMARHIAWDVGAVGVACALGRLLDAW